MADDTTKGRGSYSLPFADYYYALRGRAKDLAREIEYEREQIAARLRRVDHLEAEIKATEVAWHQLLQAEPGQVKALEAHHVAVRDALRAKGWQL